MSSAKIIVHGASSLISSVILSSPLQTNKGSKPIIGAVPPSPRTPPSLLQHTSPLLYSHHTYLVLFSHTSMPIQTVSCNTTPLLLGPCHTLSPGPQTHNVAHSDLLCTSPSTLSKQTINAYVVLFPGMKPYRYSLNVSSLLNSDTTLCMPNSSLTHARRHARMHARRQARTHANARKRTQTHANARKRTQTHANARKRTQTHDTHTHTHKQTHTHTHTHTHTGLCSNAGWRI